MTPVMKFSIGIMPVTKMFRIGGIGGAVVDAIIGLRTKALSGDAFTELASNNERTAFRITNADKSGSFEINEQHVVFNRDFYESKTSFDFERIHEEFQIIWNAANSVLEMKDIRRIGMVAEHRYKPPMPANTWLRDRLTTLETKMLTDKFLLQFEEREYARDGIAPDPKKSDFINYIYHFYDSALDASHPIDGSVNANLDVQRYFAPVHNGNVAGEVLKLHKSFVSAQKRLGEKMKALGLSDGKK